MSPFIYTTSPEVDWPEWKTKTPNPLTGQTSGAFKTNPASGANVNVQNALGGGVAVNYLFPTDPYPDRWGWRCVMNPGSGNSGTERRMFEGGDYYLAYAPSTKDLKAYRTSDSVQLGSTLTLTTGDNEVFWTVAQQQINENAAATTNPLWASEHGGAAPRGDIADGTNILTDTDLTFNAALVGKTVEIIGTSTLIRKITAVTATTLTFDGAAVSPARTNVGYYLWDTASLNLKVIKGDGSGILTTSGTFAAPFKQARASGKTFTLGCYNSEAHSSTWELIFKHFVIYDLQDVPFIPRGKVYVRDIVTPDTAYITWTRSNTGQAHYLHVNDTDDTDYVTSPNNQGLSELFTLAAPSALESNHKYFSSQIMHKSKVTISGGLVWYTPIYDIGVGPTSVNESLFSYKPIVTEGSFSWYRAPECALFTRRPDGAMWDTDTFTALKIGLRTLLYSPAANVDVSSIKVYYDTLEIKDTVADTFTVVADDLVDFSGASDWESYLDENAPDANYGSATGMVVGVIGGGKGGANPMKQHAIMKNARTISDITIPAGQVIGVAQLALHGSAYAGSGVTVHVRRSTNVEGIEGSVTWNNPNHDGSLPANSPNTAGGDRDLTVVGEGSDGLVGYVARRWHESVLSLLMDARNLRSGILFLSLWAANEATIRSVSISTTEDSKEHVHPLILIRFADAKVRKDMWRATQQSYPIHRQGI